MKTMFIKPQELVAPQVSSVSALFMSMKAEELARQLTLIEFEIYSSISVLLSAPAPASLRTSPTLCLPMAVVATQGSELLGQSWNKESLQHRSPNVMALIHRANKLSFWVSTMILNEDTHKARKKIFEKFIAISDQLFKLKNFHTLMVHALHRRSHTAPLGVSHTPWPRAEHHCGNQHESDIEAAGDEEGHQGQAHQGLQAARGDHEPAGLLQQLP
jgi:hypothetical protein